MEWIQTYNPSLGQEYGFQQQNINRVCQDFTPNLLYIGKAVHNNVVIYGQPASWPMRLEVYHLPSSGESSDEIYVLNLNAEWHPIYLKGFRLCIPVIYQQLE